MSLRNIDQNIFCSAEGSLDVCLDVELPNFPKLALHAEYICWELFVDFATSLSVICPWS